MRFLITSDEAPVNSRARYPVEAYIPPFTRDGAVIVGDSPDWSPHYDILLTRGYVQTKTEGSSSLVVTIMKIEPWKPTPTTLATVTLQAASQKTVFSFDNSFNFKTIIPIEKLYINVDSDSGHSGLFVQMLGERHTFSG